MSKFDNNIYPLPNILEVKMAVTFGREFVPTAVRFLYSFILFSKTILIICLSYGTPERMN